MPDNVSRLPDVFERLKAKNREGWRRPPLKFRDESERLDFHIEMVHIDTLARLWKMTEQVKLLNKFLDRQALTADR